VAPQDHPGKRQRPLVQVVAPLGADDHPAAGALAAEDAGDHGRGVPELLGAGRLEEVSPPNGLVFQHHLQLDQGGRSWSRMRWASWTIFSSWTHSPSKAVGWALPVRYSSGPRSCLPVLRKIICRVGISKPASTSLFFTSGRKAASVSAMARRNGWS